MKYRIIFDSNRKLDHPYVIQRKICGIWFQYGQFIYESIDEAEQNMHDLINRKGLHAPKIKSRRIKVIKEFDSQDLVVIRLKGPP